MSTFPLLSSGAVTQYPLPSAYRQSVEVIRFLDGSDQRFLAEGRIFRSWLIDLSLLTEAELQQLHSFFESQNGDYAFFEFADPVSGTNVPNCLIGTAELELQWGSVNSGSTKFWVVETNG